MAWSTLFPLQHLHAHPHARPHARPPTCTPTCTPARTHSLTDWLIRHSTVKTTELHLTFFSRVARASNSWLLAVVVLPSVTLQRNNILFFFLFNPKEKFKKVSLPWLSSLLISTKGDINPKYTERYFIAPTVSSATQIRWLTRLIANSVTDSLPFFSLLNVYMWFHSHNNIWYHRRSKVVENKVLGVLLQLSGFNWDTHTHTQMSYWNKQPLLFQRHWAEE